MTSPNRSSETRPEGREELVLEGIARPGMATALRELWHFREVLRSFTSRSVRVRYKQALLGITWAVIQPLAFLGLFVIFFGRVADISGGGVPYAAFALSALVPWQFVSNGVSLGTGSLVSDAALIRKVYFPREAAVLGAIGATGLDLAVGIGLFLALAPFLGAKLGLSFLYVPLLVVALTIPVVGICLPLAAINVYYRDFRYVLPLATQLALFASPVAYPVSLVPERWQGLYALVNPFVGPLDGFRNAMALDDAPDWHLLGLSALTGVVLLVVGYRVFKAFEPEFSDVV
jgi:ABC-type polysaccharide/polyol phosphate export permease